MFGKKMLGKEKNIKKNVFFFFTFDFTLKKIYITKIN